MLLANYFSTLNIANLAVFLLAYFIFDATGFNFAQIIKAQKYLRQVFWIWGLSFYVFIWFILHFYIPFLPKFVWASLLILGIVNLPLFLKK